MNRLNRAQRGFSILEVVIGIFIFAVGALALSLLQASLTRGQADANARAVAANIAEQLIERARGFGTLATVAGSDVPSYEALRESLFQGGLTFTRGGITYTAAVDMLDFRWVAGSSSFECFQGEFDNGTDARCITGTPPAGVYSDYKVMEVTVTWAGGEFQLQDGVATSGRLGSGEILVSGIISSVATGASARVVTTGSSDIPIPPISYTPGEKPDVVPLSLGDNKFKEALKPAPDVIRTDKIETAFEVVTYSTTNSGSVFLRQEEFLAINCTCNLKAANDNNQGRRPAIWVGDEYGGMGLVTKAYGTSVGTQSEHCTVCCRDHHDGGSGADDNGDPYANVYGPFKVDSEYTGAPRASDHEHYQTDGVTLATTGTNYLESCRMVRVAGFWRVGQDFRREDQYVFPQDFLDEEGEIDTYSTYVAGNPDADPKVDGAILEYYGSNKMGSAYPADPPCIGLDGDNDGAEDNLCEDKPDMGDAYPTALEAGELPTWTSLTDGTLESQQLRSRGIYIDYFHDDLRDYLENCINNQDEIVKNCKYGEVELDQTGSTNVLEILPFFDVQLTFLNRWNESPTNTPVDTTNEAIEDVEYDDDLGFIYPYSRGVASQTAVLTSSTVRAESERGNTGFTDTTAIEPAAIYNSKVRAAYLNVQSLDGAGGGGGDPDPDPDPPTLVSGLKQNLTGENGINGKINIVLGSTGEALCGQTNNDWNCTVPYGASTAQIVVNGYGQNNHYHWACITGLTATNVDSGKNATSTFSLVGVPAGTTYTIRIVHTATGSSGC